MITPFTLFTGAPSASATGGRAPAHARRRTLLPLGWLTALLLTLVSAAPALAQSDIYQGYTILSINGAANAYYDMCAATANPDFQGANLGTFSTGNTLTLKGGQMKTSKCGTCNVLNAHLNYRVYRTGTTPGAFTQINLPFLSNDGTTNGCGAGNQTWEQAAGAVNLLSGLTRGNYTVEVYGDSDFNGCGTGTNYCSNGGANYKATFDYMLGALCGTYTISSAAASATNFQSFGNATTGAIVYLNTNGVSCATVFNVAAGFTETLPSPTAGNITATGTSTNTITFQKNGAGANPVITSGVGTAASDAIITLVGSDYVTFDGIDLIDNAANVAPQFDNKKMEFGYALRHNSATNGAKNNTIKNCTVTLDKSDGNQTYGIGVQATTSTGTGQAATSSGGSNSSNVFTGNTLTNLSTGFLLSGTTGFEDTGNEVGQTGLGNTVTNAGGSINTTSVGVDAVGQSGLKIVGNGFTSAATGNTGTAFSGINLRSANTGTADITGNTISITYNGTTSSAYVIRNQAALTTWNVNGNTVTGTYSSATSGILYGIVNEGAVGTLNIGTTTANTIQNMNLGGSGVLYCINAGSPTTTLSIQNNIIQNSTRTSTGAFNGIYYNGTGTPTTTISANQVINNTLTTTGNAFGVQIGASSVLTALTISNNTIKNLSKGTGNALIGIRDWGGAASGAVTISNNRIWSLSATGATQVSGIDVQDGPGPVVSAQNNSVKVLASGTGFVSGIGLDYQGSGSDITADSVVTLSSAGSVTGIQAGGANATGTLAVAQNIVGGLTSSVAAGVATGIVANGPSTSTITVSRNKVYDISNSAGTVTAGSVLGISAASAGAVTIVNNTVGNLTAPAGGTDDVVRGISLTAGTTVNAYYNSVYLPSTTTSSAALFGTTGIYAGPTAAAPTTVTLRNNIVVNNSTPKGAGRAVAVKRGAAALTNYSTSSNNNLYFAGTPSATHLIYYDATTPVQTLAAFKTAMGATRESNSVTEDVPFASTTSTASNFLNIDATKSTQVESGGTPIGGVTTDFAGTTRNVTTPDIGAYEGTFSAYDIAITAITAPTSPICPNATQPVTVTLSNLSTTGSVTTSTNAVITVTGTLNRPSAPLTVALSATVPAATTIAASGTLSVNLGNQDFSVAGAYSLTNVKAVITDAATTTTFVESNSANNTFTPNPFNITVNPRPTATLNAITAVCTGNSATLTGNLTGTGPWSFTYTIDGGAPQSSGSIATSPYSITTPALNLPGSPKSIVITSLSDANCTATSLPGAQNVTVNPRPTATLNAITAVCTGNSATLTGNLTGTGPWSFTYTIDGGAPQSSGSIATSPYSITTPALNLPGSPKSIVITSLTDANTCTATSLPGAQNVTVNPRPTATLNAITAVCTGNSATLTGNLTGTGPWSFTYTIDGGAPQSSGSIATSPYSITTPALNLPGSPKSIVITSLTDANTCTATSLPGAQNVTVNPRPTASLSNNGPICAGTAATVSINLTGTSPWTFTYTDGVTPVTVTNTATNPYIFSTGSLASTTTYSLTALSDANCTAASLPGGTTVTVDPLPTFGTSKMDVSCNGGSDGSITVTAAGGTGSYQFSANNGASWTSFANPHTFSGLAAATYQIRVRNDNAQLCESSTGTVAVTVNQPTAVSFTATPSATCTGGSAGSISVSASGGTPGYTYSLDGGAFVVGSTFTGLTAGGHTIDVKDANGCLAVQQNVTVTSSATVTWNGSASTNWYTAANWTPSCVPSSTLSAVIPTASTVVIASGTATVNDLDVQGTGTLTVSGTGNLDVSGSFTTAGPGSFTASSGTTTFMGAGAQPMPAGSYHDVVLSGATAKVLTGPATLAGLLDVTAGMLRLGNFALVVADSVDGYSNTHFVVEDGTGTLTIQGVGAGKAAVFPIGTGTAASDYTPAKVRNTGTTDAFTASVTNQIPKDPTAPQFPAGQHVVQKTWDLAEGTLGGSLATLTLGWNAANEGAFFDEMLTAISHKLFVGPDSVWDHNFMGFAPASAGTLGSQWQRSRSNLTSFSPFAVEDGSQPLPVVLSRFEAERQGENAVLTWETSSERNSKGFEVQVRTSAARGSSQQEWRPLGFVATHNPTSAVAQRYAFTDTEKGKAGTRFYRLKLVAQDGSRTDGPVRTVQFGAITAPALAAHPNPFADGVTVQLTAPQAGEAMLTLVDALGRTVLTQVVTMPAGISDVRLAVPTGLPSGTYTLTAQIAGQVLHTRLVKE